MAVLLSLAACASLNPFSSSGPKKQPVACPGVSILRDAGAVSQFDGTGTGDDNVISRAELFDFTGECGGTEKNVDVELKVVLLAERAPGRIDPTLSYDYFVAVLDPSENILSKNNYTATVTFDEGSEQASRTDTVTQTVPVADGQTIKDYRVVLGLQLDQEQLDYNRKLLNKAATPSQQQPVPAPVPKQKKSQP